jgi:ABC-2 type transport system permease protein
MTLDPANAFHVARREYLENIRTRGFWISILLLPIVILLVSFAPIALREAESAAQYAVLDQSDWVSAALAERIARADLEILLSSPIASADVLVEARATDARERAQIINEAARLIAHGETSSTDSISLPARLARYWREHPDDIVRFAPGVSIDRYRLLPNAPSDRAALNALVDDGTLLGYFVIPEDPVTSGAGAEYVTRNLTNVDLRRWFGEQVTAVVRNRRLRSENVSDETASWIQQPIEFAPLQITETGRAAHAGIEETLAQWAPVGFVYLLWISIFSVTQMLLTSTVEEKSNKLVEVLLSSIEAIDLMAGKICGIAATGLTIVGAWLAMVVAATLWLPGLLGAPATLDLSVLVENPVYLGSFVVYFLLGYLFYAALLCGLGSFANNLKEAQNLMIPVQLFMFAPLVFMIPIGRDPGGWLAETMSWFPPLTPFVMMNRAAMPPSLLVYVGTTLLMIVSIYLALRIAARIFETGILMTGKPPRLRHVLRSLRQRTT